MVGRTDEALPVSHAYVHKAEAIAQVLLRGAHDPGNDPQGVGLGCDGMGLKQETRALVTLRVGSER